MAAHRVTAKHVNYLAAAPGRADGTRGSVLADTDHGIRLVDPGQVLAPGSGVRRVLLTRTELLDLAGGSGLAVSGFVRANAGRIARELDSLITDDRPPAADRAPALPGRIPDMNDEQITARYPAAERPPAGLAPARPDLAGAEETAVLNAAGCLGAPAGFEADCGEAGPHGPH